MRTSERCSNLHAAHAHRRYSESVLFFELPAYPAMLPADFGSPAAIGRILYTTWLYPFEITSILLLVAVIGAVVLAKRKFA